MKLERVTLFVKVAEKIWVLLAHGVRRKERTMTDRELLQQALEVLEEAQSYTSCQAWSPSMTKDCAEIAKYCPKSCSHNESECALNEWAKDNQERLSRVAVLQQILASLEKP